ncbi:MAG TPA: phospholipase A [Bdellovibrionales bacterium]|nr:phospholipase A [Bdellovibrionales bacterium]
MLALLFTTLIAAHAQKPGDASLVEPEHKRTSTRVEKEEAVLQRHLPFYFAYGRPTSKLQVSFKTPIIREWPLFFGYTQFMFWALEEESKPFRDLTYNPELFYRWSPPHWRFVDSIDFGAWSHTSNGKKDADSRSLEKNYVRFNFEREGPRWITRLGLQAAYLHGFDETNMDIQNYIGPLSVSVSFVQLFDSWVDKSELALQVSPSGKFSENWDRGGYLISWAFRLGKFSLVPAFYTQYYYGYAETLLNYDQQVAEFRAGVIF